MGKHPFILVALCVLICFCCEIVASNSLRTKIGTSWEEVEEFFSFSHKFHRKAHVPTVGMSVSYSQYVKNDDLHSVVISVKRKNFDRLKGLVDDISNPYSARYGQHMSRDDVATMISNPDGVHQIKSFLSQYPQLRISKESRYGEYLTVEGPVGLWNKLFKTQLHHVAVHNDAVNEADRSFVRGKEYSLPLELVDHVQEVFNLVQIPPAVQKHQIIYRGNFREGSNVQLSSSVLSFPDQVTPALLNSYYHISNNTGNHMIRQSVYETLNQSASPSDLKQFQETFSIPVQSLSEIINGHVFNGACLGANGFDDCGEANLDVQYLMGVAQNIPTVYYYWGGEDFMLDWITQVADMANPPEVFSISYGSYEINFDSSYLASFDQEAIILASIGTTIFASSGDDGVAGYAVRNLPRACDYYPQFPASSPMVTTVGATNGPQANRTEVVCQSNENDALITSGGGFSDVYPQPSWQSKFVQQYFSEVTGTTKQPVSGYSATGRGYPDVALLGHAYVIVAGGEYLNVDGTSASAPVMAGFAALVNAQRKSQGLSTLGWLNPALYATYDSYIHDIVAGNNNCTASSTCCKQGFYAAEGWDPTTGLGSVMFDNFFATLSTLQALNNTDYDDFTGQSSDNDDDDAILISGGAVVGIIVAVIIVCLAIGVVVAYFCISKQSVAMSRQENPIVVVQGQPVGR